MKQVWITGAMLLFLFASTAQTQTMSFLDVTVTGVERSLVCPDSEGCQSLFLISGRNFLNSNGELGVKVGDEWAQILRATNALIVAVASEGVLNKTPSVSVDATFTRPKLLSSDETLVHMFEESLDVALDSIEVSAKGKRYVTAGPKYGSPERVYYRDTYWTSGLILMIEPYVIRDQILLLASGIEASGSTPSAIPVDPSDPKLALWVDHVDAGPYFVMLVRDYVAWTGDGSILSERVNGRTVFTAMEDTISWLSTKDTDGNLLPEKPENSLQDWLDSIPRGGEVFSNEVLYYKAMRDLVELAEIFGKPSHAQAFHRQSLLVRYQIHQQFWNEGGGYFYELCKGGVCVDRITNESAMAILFDLATQTQRDTLFESLRTLESENNSEIAYGDWGVLNAWPLYEGFTPYDYQNGTDWPFLDGINAGARLKYHNNDWYYPLTRWWTFNREQDSGRVLPEHVSPVDLDGGDQQAWSVNPIASFIRYGIGLDPDINGYYTTKRSPRGDIRLEDIIVRGQRISVEARGE
jgi:glycogen debranching enzyme